MSQPTNAPSTDRPLTTSDVSPPDAAASVAGQTRIGGFRVPTDSLRAYTMVFALVLIWLFFHWMTDGIFLSPRNFSNLFKQTAVTGVLAVGMLMVIVAGENVLSVGLGGGCGGRFVGV